MVPAHRAVVVAAGVRLGVTLVLLGAWSGMALAQNAAPAAPADPRLSEAAQETAYLNFERAYTLYSGVRASSTEGSAAWQEAVYGQAISAQQITPGSAGRINEATQLYTLLLDKTPDSKFAPRATMNLGRILELSDYYGDGIDLEGARGWYAKAAERWANDPIASEATLRIAGTYIQTFKTEQVHQGIDLLESWLKAHPNDPLASAMLQYAGDTYYYPLRQYDKALACYVKVDELGWMDDSNKGASYWRMARLADRFVHDRELAIRYYTKIITDTPTSGKAYESQEALKRLGVADPPAIMIRSRSPATAPTTAPRQQQ
jgi:tetratricopeptide (TPR) repeat protein